MSEIESPEDLEAEQLLAAAAAQPDPEKAEPDWKAHAREWEKRAKANATAAQRLKEIEDAQKTEAQRLSEQLAEAQRAAQESQAQALRLRLALKHGISDEDAEVFLTAADEETLTRQAERLAALRSQPTQNGRQPVEALKSGALPAGEPATVDPNEWMRKRASRT